MGLRRFIRSSLVALALGAGLPAAAGAESLLDRVQGLYRPANLEGPWDCRTLGADGGAVGIQGQRLIGVENTCTLENAFAIPGLDAMAFDLACSAEGMTHDGGRVLLVPLDGGLGLVREGSVVVWTRCP
ncbi:MAG: hypothetical protein ACOCTP_01205 [Roseicyclus sp.]